MVCFTLDFHVTLTVNLLKTSNTNIWFIKSMVYSQQDKQQQVASDRYTVVLQ